MHTKKNVCIFVIQNKRYNNQIKNRVMTTEQINVEGLMLLENSKHIQTEQVTTLDLRVVIIWQLIINKATMERKRLKLFVNSTRIRSLNTLSIIVIDR